MLAADFGGLFDRSTVGDMTAVLERKRHPCRRVKFLRHLEEHFDFVESGLCFNAQEVGAGLNQGLHAQLMKRTVFIVGEMIVARIFGTVGKVGTVRAHGAGNQKGFRIFFGMTGQEIGTSFLGKRHGLCDEIVCGFRVEPARLESGFGRLVARRNGDIGTRFEIVAVNLTNLCRFFNQYARAPKLVV